MPENNKQYTYYNICKDLYEFWIQKVKNPDIFC